MSIKADMMTDAVNPPAEISQRKTADSRTGQLDIAVGLMKKSLSNQIGAKATGAQTLTGTGGRKEMTDKMKGGL